MDQTKFINSYINNLAEQLKTMTLDNIMIKTQLTIANETIAELQSKITEFEQAAKPGKKAKDNWEEGSFTKEEQDPVDVNSSSNKKKRDDWRRTRCW